MMPPIQRRGCRIVRRHRCGHVDVKIAGSDGVEGAQGHGFGDGGDASASIVVVNEGHSVACVMGYFGKRHPYPILMNYRRGREADCL